MEDRFWLVFWILVIGVGLAIWAHVFRLEKRIKALEDSQGPTNDAERMTAYFDLLQKAEKDSN